MSINIHLDADPVKIWDSAIDITSIKTIVDGVEDDLINAKRDLVDQEGDAVLAFSSCIVGLINDCQSLFADLASYQVALENLSSDLGGVEDEFTSIRESAITGGLTVVGEEIIEPPQLFYANVDSGDPQQVDEYNRAQARIKVWNGLIPLVRDARDKEVRARQEFTDACNAIVANPILNFMTSTVKGFFVPSGVGFGLAGAARASLWALDRSRDAAAFAEGAGLRLSSPYVTHTLANGKTVAARAASGRTTVGSWHHAIQDGQLSNWHSASSKARSTGARVAEIAGRARPILKAAEVAGTALTFGISAYEQWQKDSHNPSLGESERVARATRSGALTAAGAWIGAQGGGKVGAAIGVCLGGPLGAAVGGVVGGVVGGALGAWGGQSAANIVNDGIHALTSWFKR